MLYCRLDFVNDLGQQIRTYVILDIDKVILDKDKVNSHFSRDNENKKKNKNNMRPCFRTSKTG